MEGVSAQPKPKRRLWECTKPVDTSGSESSENYGLLMPLHRTQAVAAAGHRALGDVTNTTPQKSPGLREWQESPRRRTPIRTPGRNNKEDSRCFSPVGSPARNRLHTPEKNPLNNVRGRAPLGSRDNSSPRRSPLRVKSTSYDQVSFSPRSSQNMRQESPRRGYQVSTPLRTSIGNREQSPRRSPAKHKKRLTPLRRILAENTTALCSSPRRNNKILEKSSAAPGIRPARLSFSIENILRDPRPSLSPSQTAQGRDLSLQATPAKDPEPYCHPQASSDEVKTDINDQQAVLTDSCTGEEILPLDLSAGQHLNASEDALPTQCEIPLKKRHRWLSVSDSNLSREGSSPPKASRRSLDSAALPNFLGSSQVRSGSKIPDSKHHSSPYALPKNNPRFSTGPDISKHQSPHIVSESKQNIKESRSGLVEPGHISQDKHDNMIIPLVNNTAQVPPANMSSVPPPYGTVMGSLVMPRPAVSPFYHRSATSPADITSHTWLQTSPSPWTSLSPRTPLFPGSGHWPISASTSPWHSATSGGPSWKSGIGSWISPASGTQVFSSSGSQKYLSSGGQKFLSSGSQDFTASEGHREAFLSSGSQAFSSSTSQKFLSSGNQSLSSGTLVLSSAGGQAVSVSGSEKFSSFGGRPWTASAPEVESWAPFLEDTKQAIGSGGRLAPSATITSTQAGACDAPCFAGLDTAGHTDTGVAEEKPKKDKKKSHTLVSMTPQEARERMELVKSLAKAQVLRYEQSESTRKKTARPKNPPLNIAGRIVQMLENCAKEKLNVYLLNEGFAIKDPWWKDPATEVEVVKETQSDGSVVTRYFLHGKELNQRDRRGANRCARREKGSSPYLCIFCGFRFPDATDMSRHTRTHTEVHPFKCEECGEPFKQNVSLEGHKSTEHRIPAPVKNSRREKKYVCEFNGELFDSSEEFLEHTRVRCPHHLNIENRAKDRRIMKKSGSVKQEVQLS